MRISSVTRSAGPEDTPEPRTSPPTSFPITPTPRALTERVCGGPTPPFVRDPKFEQVADFGHFLHLERPAEVNRHPSWFPVIV